MEFLKLVVFILVPVNVLVSSQVLDKSKLLPFCRTKVDLAFVIDSSRSISREDFGRQMAFVQDIVGYLDIGADSTRVAAVSFSNYVFPEFLFNPSATKADVLADLGNIKQSMGDATRTYLALEHVHDVIFAPGNGERPDVIDVVVVLTDGETNPGSYDKHWAASGKKQTQIEAAKIKQRPAYLFAIGVGNRIDEAELNGMSSDPDETFTILVSSFKELNSDYVKKILLDRACVIETTPAPPITTPTTTTTKEPEKIEPKCTETVADIFFVLDESSSIKTSTNFKKELDFVISVVDYLQIGPGKTQVGVMTFSDQPKLKFSLTEYSSKSDLAQAITEISWHGGNTFLDRALKLLRERGLNPSYGSRPDVPQIAVIVTDGVSTDPSQTRRELARLHGMDYSLFAVGVGPDRNKAELELIANDPTRVFEVENLEGLQEIRKALATRLCDQGITVSDLVRNRKPKERSFFLK